MRGGGVALANDPPFYRAAFWSGSATGGTSLLPVPDTSGADRDSTSKAGNFAGVFVGESDAPDHLGRPYPCYWPDASTFAVLADQTGTYTSGTFWDVDEEDNAVGSYKLTTGGQLRAFIYDRSVPSTNFSFDLAGRAGSGARAVNKDGLVGGWVIGAPGSVAVVWQKDAQGLYQVIKTASNAEGWDRRSDRASYVVAVTDTVAGDPNSPYAVDWMLPTTASDLPIPGEAFVWSLGYTGDPDGRVRWVGTAFGEPRQATNRAYSTSRPVVTFARDSPFPYVWTGSPDPAAANDGAASDLWSYLDPDADSSVTGISLTGIQREFVAGGHIVISDPPSTDLWMAGGSDWALGSASPTHSLVYGAGVGGATTDMKLMDGRYYSVERGAVPNPLLPRVLVQAQEFLAAVPAKIAVRATARREHAGAFTVEVQMFNWTTLLWDTLGTAQNLDVHMRTIVRTVSTGVSSYVKPGTGEVLARAGVRASGPGGTALWRASFESVRVLVLP
ncbi:MAG: hypothetical protein IT207_04190 [Fimbriimonadaceae bacterium]|nr:hypothetical protein [Fimbriimonadaceae bacterium]